MRFSVLTWNIHKGIGGVDRRYRPERIVEVIARYEPDIALLQEVDDGARRSGYDRQVDLLGDALEMRHRCFLPTHRLRQRPGQYGNAILSRWPLSGVKYQDLSIKLKKKRGAIHARARVRFRGHTRTVVVYNLHLGLAGFERGIQLRKLLDSAHFERLHTRTPVVLGGDLNDLWGTLGPRFLAPAGFRRAGPLSNTYPAVLPARPLDGIFVRGDLEVRRAFASRTRAAREASDHVPLIAHMDLVV